MQLCADDSLYHTGFGKLAFQNYLFGIVCQQVEFSNLPETLKPG